MKNLVKQKFRYELQRFENITVPDMARFLRDNPDLDDVLIADFQATIDEEVQIIKENFRLSIFIYDGDRALESYIQFHQQALIGLAGHLLSYVTPAHLTSSAGGSGTSILSHVLYRATEDLLAFIETHFTQYFDQDAWIPPSYQRIVCHELATDLDSLEETLLTKGMSPRLMQVSLQPLKDFIGTAESAIATYRRVIYLKQFKKALQQLAAAQHAGSINRQVRELLHYLNFYSQDYFTYCIQYIERHLDSPDMSDQVGTLILDRYRKLIIQQQVKPGFALYPSPAPSLASMLCDWIDAASGCISPV